MVIDQVSKLRHGLRGSINAIKLGVSALEVGLTTDESVEFLDYIIQACDQIVDQLGEYESLPQVMAMSGS